MSSPHRINVSTHGHLTGAEMRARTTAQANADRLRNQVAAGERAYDHARSVGRIWARTPDAVRKTLPTSLRRALDALLVELEQAARR